MPSPKSPVPSPENFSAVYIQISGRVQGVGFRYFTQEHAVRLGLTGWVCNTADRGVKVEAEGPKSVLEEWIKLLKRGPQMSFVDALTAQWVPYNRRYKNFEIR